MSIERKVLEEFVSWAAKYLAPWQHEAFRRLYAKGELSTEDRVEIYKQARIDLGVDEVESALPDRSLILEEFGATVVKHQNIKLLELRDLENVNAIKPGQCITFSPNLTVIYGENGSGKSGFARVTKQACRCHGKATERILPNVFEPLTLGKVAKATFKISVDGEESDIAWRTGDDPVAELQKFAIFDSKCAQVCIAEDNQLSFSPRIFALFEQLGAFIKAVRDKLQEEATRAKPDKTAMQSLVSTSTTGRFIAGISPATLTKDIQDRAQWNEDNDRALVCLKIEEARLRGEQPVTRRVKIQSRIRQLESLCNDINTKIRAVSDENVNEFRDLFAALERTRNEYIAAGRAITDESELNGIPSDVWRDLLFAAARYSGEYAYPSHPFPHIQAGSKCVLCQQAIDNANGDRLVRFWNFLQQDASTRMQNQGQEIQRLLSGFTNLSVDLPQAIILISDELRQNYPEFWHELELFLDQLRKRRDAVQAAAKDNNWEILPALSSSVVDVCERLLADSKSALDAIKDDKVVEDTLRQLAQDIIEAETRKRLSVNLPAVLEHLKRLKVATTLELAIAKISTTGLSTAASALHKKYVTEEFNKSVLTQLKSLRARTLRIAIAGYGERGRVMQIVELEKAKSNVAPIEVLSEGERTAVALAYFLSDTFAESGTAGMIFDDPVTSLDERIRGSVAKALVARAKAQQVVVMTHDLVFFCELLAAARKHDIVPAVYRIVSFSSIFGQVEASLPRVILPVKSRFPEIEELAARARKADAAGDARNYEETVFLLYARLRQAYERAVEELLFANVVRRYQKDIGTLQLTDINIDKESIEAVFEGMSRCSDFVHDNDEGSAPPIPSVPDLLADVDKFKTFVGRQEKMNDTARKANAHLKAKALK